MSCVGVGVNDVGIVDIVGVAFSVCVGKEGDIVDIEGDICNGAAVIILAVVIEGSSTNIAVFNHILIGFSLDFCPTLFLSSISH